MFVVGYRLTRLSLSLSLSNTHSQCGGRQPDLGLSQQSQRQALQGPDGELPWASGLAHGRERARRRDVQGHVQEVFKCTSNTGTRGAVNTARQDRLFWVEAFLHGTAL